jgi:hypothetical protein
LVEVQVNVTHTYYSIRSGKTQSPKGLGLEDIKTLFLRVFNNLCADGYFDESFGYTCTDIDHVSGKVKDVELEIIINIRKRNLWPIGSNIHSYSEDDLFDIVEYLYQNVSAPIDGYHHSWNDCGMHWNVFDREEGKIKYREKINELLLLYERKFELSENGEILTRAEEGFDKIFVAKIPTNDDTVVSRIESATVRYRRHGAKLDDRRQAVRDLADVLEKLRPKISKILSKSDEHDLFNIANNFGIRHFNDKQKTDYDWNIWLSWMFYFYLSTIHVLLRKIEE